MNKKNKKKSSLPGIVAALLIVMLVEAIPVMNMASIFALIITVAVIAAVVLLLLKLRRKILDPENKSACEKPSKSGGHISFVPKVHLHSDGSECVNTLRGRAKYYAQLDGFLKNGIIGRDEYKFMRERYEKMDIPDDL